MIADEVVISADLRGIQCQFKMLKGLACPNGSDFEIAEVSDGATDIGHYCKGHVIVAVAERLR